MFVIKLLQITAWAIMLTTTACDKFKSGPSPKNAGPADLVLRGGKVATVDEDFSIREAVAVRGDRIIYVGDNAGAADYIGPQTRVLDLEGKLVLPGLIDCHGHMHDLGEQLTRLDITGTGSYQEIIDQVAQKARRTPPGEWIIGERWDQNAWPVKEFPVHDPLSEVTPDHPVFLYRIDGHAALLNQKALNIAGITPETPDPFGGVILRKQTGEPTGVLINRAMTLVEKLLPAPTEQQYRANFLRAVDHSLALGLTGWHEAGVNPKKIEFYKDLIDANLLKMRIFAILGEQDSLILEQDLTGYFNRHKIKDYGNHFLSVQCVKLFLDGSLGSRGAALFEPYSDDPNNVGLLRVSPDYIDKVARAALETGMGVSTHCIGTRAVSLCLDAYERALKERPTADHRFRIEHAQIVREQDVARFAQLGVIPSMRPSHCLLDMGFVEERIGPERAAGAFAWRWFLDAGCIIPCGSDFPVVSNNPMLGIYAAVARQDLEGKPEGGWYGRQKMTIEEAIRGFTSWAAYAAFQEEVLGSVEPGKLADLVVLDKDILTIKPKEILTAQVLYTIVGGKIVYEKGR